MKTFIAYRFTGEDPKLLEPLLVSVRDALLKKDVDVYCTFFEEDDFKNRSLNAREIMDHAFGIIDTIDFLFVLLTSEKKSEGMIMEIGYCIARGIPVIVAVKEGLTNTYLPDMGVMKLAWTDPSNLAELIEQSDLQALLASTK